MFFVCPAFSDRANDFIEQRKNLASKTFQYIVVNRAH